MTTTPRDSCPTCGYAPGPGAGPSGAQLVCADRWHRDRATTPRDSEVDQDDIDRTMLVCRVGCRVNLSKPQAENLANYIESLRTELAEAKEYVAIAGERATAAESERDRYEEVLERMTRGIDANPTRVFDEGDAERGWQYAASILSIIEARVANALHPQGED